MKFDTYLKSGAKLCFMTLIMSATVFATEPTDSKQHIPVGIRSVTTESESLESKQARIASKLALGEDLSDEQISAEERAELRSLTSEKKTGEESEEKIAKGNRSTYYTSHSGAIHTPIGISYLGEFVELEDGSFWEVESGDRYKTLNWLTGDTLIIKRNSEWFKSHKYRLINVTTGVEVRVNLYLGPVYNGIYTNWIVAIDQTKGNLLLQDGSLWQLSFAESSEYRNWLSNDTIIIGVNDGWFMGTYPNLLINVNTNNDTIGNCI